MTTLTEKIAKHLASQDSMLKKYDEIVEVRLYYACKAEEILKIVEEHLEGPTFVGSD